MDVAKEAQVSIATASRVLNGSTRKVRNQSYVKVMEAATKLNYRPNAYAQAVAKGTAPNIVLLVSDISDPYFASVSQGVVKAAAERGISVTIGVAATPHEELEAVRKSVSTRPRGIIISESEYTDAPERQALQTELTQYEASGGRAVFVLNRNLPFPAVDVANDVGARAIAKLIVDSGYTRPAILKGDDAHRSSKERLAGVMEVLAMVAARQISRPRLWNVHARILLPVLAMMRCDISSADALVNDNTRISSGVARFVASSHAIYPTMVVVLPVPAPASTRVL